MLLKFPHVGGEEGWAGTDRGRKSRTQCFGACAVQDHHRDFYTVTVKALLYASTFLTSGPTTVNSWYTSFPIFRTNLFLKKKRRDHSVRIILQAVSPLTVWRASSRASSESPDCSSSSSVGFLLACPGPRAGHLCCFHLPVTVYTSSCKQSGCPCPVLS